MTKGLMFFMFLFAIFLTAKGCRNTAFSSRSRIRETKSNAEQVKELEAELKRTRVKTGVYQNP